MPETVLEQHYRDRIQSVRRIAHHEDGDAALSERDYEDLAALCCELSESGRQFLELEYKRLFKEPSLTVGWLRERRQVIEELSNNFLEMVAFLKNSASQVAGSSPGHDIVRRRLDEAVQRLVEAKQSVLERWPVGSDQEIAQARMGGFPEDYLDADEAFAQIAGVDVETWRQRAEKSRQAQQD